MSDAGKALTTGGEHQRKHAGHLYGADTGGVGQAGAAVDEDEVVVFSPAFAKMLDVLAEVVSAQFLPVQRACALRIIGRLIPGQEQVNGR